MSGPRRAAIRLCCAAVVAVAALAGCSSSGGPVHYDGITFSQHIGLPLLDFPATDGRTTGLAERCAHRVCVLAFAALSDRAATTFVHRLVAAARDVPDHPLVVVATIDTSHDTLALMRSTYPGAVGERGNYPLTEAAARSALIDVEPPASTPVPAVPQAVAFDTAGDAVVAWPLSTSERALHHDLDLVAR